jgi:hypothetical protein
MRRVPITIYDYFVIGVLIAALALLAWPKLPAGHRSEQIDSTRDQDSQ